MMHSIQDYYDFIESQNVHDHHHVTSAIKKLQDEITDQVTKENLSTEIFAMDFMLRHGKIEGIYKTTNEEGDRIYEYPNHNDITPIMIEYLLERINKTNNFSAKARYAQVIVNCIKGSDTGQATKLLIDAYIGFIDKLITEPFVEGERCFMIRSAVENLYPHAAKLRWRFNEVNSLVKKIIFNEGVLSPSFRVSMIDFLFQQRKQFDKSTLKECYSLCEKMYNNGEVNDLRLLEEINKVALSLIRSVGGDFKIWHNRLAAGYEAEIDKNTHDESGIIALENCHNALEKYRLAKNEVKIREITLRYAELRKKLKFSTIEHSFDVKELNKHFNHFKTSLKKLLANNSEFDIIDFFVNEPKLFPQLNLIKKRVKEKKQGFLDFVTLLKLDINKNFQMKISSKEERELNKLYETFHFDMQLYLSQQLQLIFYYGYTHDKINYRSLVSYIKQRTWMGKNLSRINSGGEKQTYNWLSLLGPAILELFSALEVSFKLGKKPINLVLALDSLTLKFEGLLRDFSRLAGAETIINAKNIIREMFIEELLETKQIQEFFSEDDRMLFRYVFVSKYGLNLRNQIAHCFLRPRQYDIDKVLLVLVAILRLGKYTINTNNVVA